MVLMLGASIAVAAPPKQAVDLSTRAHAAYKARDYVKAVDLFQQAYAVFPSAKLLYNLASAHEGARDYVGCARTLSRYLASEDAQDQAAAARWLAKVERRLARTHGRVRVVLSIPGARFELAGQAHDSPWAGWVAPGAYTVSVVDKRVVPVEQAVTVAKGQRQEVAVGVAWVPVPRRRFETVHRRERQDVPALAPPPIIAKSVGWKRPVGWITLGVGLAVAGAGLGVHMTQIERALAVKGKTVPENFADDINAFTPIYAALYSVGGAVAAGGLVLLLLKDDDDDAETGLWLAPDPVRGGVLFGGAF